MGLPRKGLQNLRTRSGALGSGTQSNDRHVRYFKLGSLELERARRIRERRAFAKRITEIDARLRGLDEEIRGCKAMLDNPDAEQARQIEGAGQEGEGGSSGRRFVLRY